MLPKDYYKDSAFFFEFESSINDPESVLFLVAQEIFSKTNKDYKIKCINPILNGLDYDFFIIECESFVLGLKISFDVENRFLINESEILSSNTSDLLPKYIDSGTLKIGDDIRYLLYEVDQCYDISDLGRNFVYENSRVLIGCLYLLDGCKSKINFSEYADLVFEQLNVDSFSEKSQHSIFLIQDQKKIKNIHLNLKKSLESLTNTDLLNENSFCCGNLDIYNLTSNGSLFKFTDVSCGFNGSRMLDVCFLCLNLCFNERDFNHLIKEYGLFYDLEYNQTKEDFRYCLNAACSVFLCKLLFEFLIEQCIYNSKRQDKVALILKKLDSCEWAAKHLDCYNDIQEDMISIFGSIIDNYTK